MVNDPHNTHELGLLQRWMQNVVTHPGGIARGIIEAGGRHGVDAGPDDVERIIAPSATLSGAERLAIYSRSYHARLIQCFRTMFPALLHALGEELFDHFAIDYLRHYPPASYTLDRLADQFPHHLAATRPDADAPPEERESWPDFIAELATLELAFLKIFDGPGTEGMPLPGVRDIVAVADDDLLNLSPMPVPSLKLFTLRYPVHEYLIAVRKKDTPEIPMPRSSHVLLSRRNYRVVLYEIPGAHHQVLDALDGVRTLGDVLGKIYAENNPIPPSHATVREWLHDWVAKGLVERIYD